MPNVLPEFEVYTCGNYGVSVKIRDTEYDEYEINYNDGSPPVVVNPQATHNYTYASSVPRTITVRGRHQNAVDPCNPAGRIVTPLVTLPAPTINLLQVLDEGSIRLEFDGQSNILYTLRIATNNSATFQQLPDTLYNTTVDTIFNLRTDDNYYCFQVWAYDPCTDRYYPSNTICSANLDLSTRNNAIDVTWTTSGVGVSDFLLTRTAGDGVIFTSPSAASPYADLGVTCGMEYCYQLTTNYPGGVRSVSLNKCGTGFSTDTPTAIGNITSLVGDNSVVLEWQPDPNFIPADYTLEKSDGGNFNFLATTTQNAFADAAFIPGEPACYRIQYTDVCGNASPMSAEACPVVLTGKLLDDNSISLTWTPYNGWKQGVSQYIVEKYSEDGQLLQSFPVGSNTTYIDDSDDLDFQTFVYVIKVQAVEAGLAQALSNRIPILKDPNLFHPTAFTPNGDNLNDHFTVFGQYVVGFEMKIFNRWGELLFNTDNISAGWDGNFRGREMPEGTYTFIAHITDRAGRTFKRSGSVLLLRK